MKSSTHRPAFLRILVSLTMLAAFFTLVPAAIAGSNTYTVQEGDTLGSIALAQHVTVQSIVDANSTLKSPWSVYAGQQLSIPDANLAAGQSIWSGFGGSQAGVPVTGSPAAGGSASLAQRYEFSSATNQCGWGAMYGQVVFGKLFVSPGFHLRQWLKWNPGVTFAQLQVLNPGLFGGGQSDCRMIELPSM